MWALTAALFFFQAAGAVTEGNKALEEGRYDAAVQAFTKAIAADSGDYSLHFNLALAYSFLQKDDEALAEYRKVLELRPGLYEAQLNAGILYLRQKDPRQALPLLESAADQKPKEFRPRLYLADAQLGAGLAPQAEQNYRAALEADGKSPAAHLGLARSLAQQDKVTEAAPHFRQAAEANAEYRDSLLELAVLYEKKGLNTEALAIYREFPDNPAAQEHAGHLLLVTKQYSEALPGLERAFTESPSKANRLALAEAYLFSGQAEKALPLLDKSVAEEPANYDLRLIYARALRDQKRYQPAADQFLQAVKIKPDAAHTWDELGATLYLADNYPQALAAFDRAQQLGEKTAGNWFLRAIILDKGRQIKPALEAYRQFLALSEGKNPDQEFQARQRVRILQRELDRR